MRCSSINVNKIELQFSEPYASTPRFRSSEPATFRVSRSTCPPPSPYRHANSFVIGTAVINAHTASPIPRSLSLRCNGLSLLNTHELTSLNSHIADHSPLQWSLMMMNLLLFLQKQNLASAIYMFGLGTRLYGPGLKHIEAKETYYRGKRDLL
jgi:hypothetical protein